MDSRLAPVQPDAQPELGPRWEVWAVATVALVWLSTPLLGDNAKRADPSLELAVVLLGAFLLTAGVLLRLRALRRRFALELTEHDQAQRQLRVHETQSHALLNALPDLIFRLDDAGHVTPLSSAARAAHASNSALDRLVPEPYAAQLLSRARDVRATGVLGHLEYQLRVGDELSDVEARIARCDAEQVVVMVRGVSQRRRLERDLIAAREAALEAARVKTKFLANMSHEIRTPMNGVIGMTNLLLETELSNEQSEYAQIIQKSGQALLSIIDDILDFAKIEAGKLQLEDVEFDLHGCVDDSLEALSSQAALKGLELAAVFGTVPSRVHGDPTRLRQVLANLLSNAVRYTERGAVVVRIERADNDPTRLAIAVQDTGQGIDEEERPTLFQPVLLGQGSKSPGSGTGLGLAIARELVQLMGGEIRYEARPEGGSIFTFTARLLGRDSERGSLETGSLQHVDACVVLVRAPGAFTLATQLRALHVQVREVAPDHLHALAPDASVAPCLAIIVDASVLASDVPQVLSQLRQEGQSNESVPLVLVASVTNEPDDELRKQATRVLNWPVRQTELAACLSALLTRSHAPHSSLPPAPTRASHVLVADDDPINQRVLRRVLTQLGCTCELAGDGREAVDKALNARFDLVLMDCQMPWLDGFDACRALRMREGAWRNTVVAMTASNSDDDKRRSREVGMDGFFTKPVAPEQLRELLGMVARGQGDAPPLAALDALFELAPRALEAMRVALDVGDLDAVAKAAGNLRGACERVSATRLAGLCLELIEHAQSGRTSSAERGLEAVSAELDIVRRRRATPRG